MYSYFVNLDNVKRSFVLCYSLDVNLLPPSSTFSGGSFIYYCKTQILTVYEQNSVQNNNIQ